MSLIVPVITLTVSVLLFSSIGYALTSSVTNYDNEIDVESTEINLCEDRDGTMITYPAFSNGRVAYQYSDHTYKIRENQDVFLSDDTTYIKSNMKGDVSVSITWSSDIDLFKMITVALGNKSVNLNPGNSYTATFADDNSVDSSIHPLKVTMKGTTSGYKSGVDPTGLAFSVKFTLTMIS